ncbi:hypothetical protein BKA70DRAFT_1425560 [Coprinopsis sp. MPI-PUGE-AT-0042]|nr:hypothetical protein BKA70DRAFT_1425560 [Coprinopsis sp. MPI-PUGE-AT-0042]
MLSPSHVHSHPFLSNSTGFNAPGSSRAQEPPFARPQSAFLGTYPWACDVLLQGSANELESFFSCRSAVCSWPEMQSGPPHFLMRLVTAFLELEQSILSPYGQTHSGTIRDFILQPHQPLLDQCAIAQFPLAIMILENGGVCKKAATLASLCRYMALARVIDLTASLQGLASRSELVKKSLSFREVASKNLALLHLKNCGQVLATSKQALKKIIVAVSSGSLVPNTSATIREPSTTPSALSVVTALARSVEVASGYTILSNILIASLHLHYLLIGAKDLPDEFDEILPLLEEADRASFSALLAQKDSAHRLRLPLLFSLLVSPLALLRTTKLWRMKLDRAQLFFGAIHLGNDTPGCIAAVSKAIWSCIFGIATLQAPIADAIQKLVDSLPDNIDALSIDESDWFSPTQSDATECPVHPHAHRMVAAGIPQPVEGPLPAFDPSLVTVHVGCLQDHPDGSLELSVLRGLLPSRQNALVAPPSMPDDGHALGVACAALASDLPPILRAPPALDPLLTSQGSRLHLAQTPNDVLHSSQGQDCPPTPSIEAEYYTQFQTPGRAFSPSGSPSATEDGVFSGGPLPAHEDPPPNPDTFPQLDTFPHSPPFRLESPMDLDQDSPDRPYPMSAVVGPVDLALAEALGPEVDRRPRHNPQDRAAPSHRIVSSPTSSASISDIDTPGSRGSLPPAAEQSHPSSSKPSDQSDISAKATSPSAAAKPTGHPPKQNPTKPKRNGGKRKPKRAQTSVENSADELADRDTGSEPEEGRLMKKSRTESPAISHGIYYLKPPPTKSRLGDSADTAIVLDQIRFDSSKRLAMSSANELDTQTPIADKQKPIGDDSEPLPPRRYYGPKGETFDWEPAFHGKDATFFAMWDKAIREPEQSDSTPLHLRDSGASSAIHVLSEASYGSMTSVERRKLWAGSTTPKRAIILTEVGAGDPKLEFDAAGMESLTGRLDEIIEVQDQSVVLENGGEPTARIRLTTLSELLEYSKTPLEQRKNINALNFPMPPGLRPEILSAIATAYIAWLRTHHNNMCFSSYPSGQTQWGLLAYNGALHYLHIDAEGFGTWIEVKCGAKLWVIAYPPSNGQLPSLSDINAYELDSELFCGEPPEGWTLEAVVLTPGTRLIMAPNTPHAIWTLEDSICHGGHFYTIPALLDTAAGLVHTFIRDGDVTNTSHTAASRLLLRRLVHYFHQSFVINNGSYDASHADADHLPDFTDPNTFQAVFSLLFLIELQNVLDPRSYKTPDPA